VRTAYPSNQTSAFIAQLEVACKTFLLSWCVAMAKQQFGVDDLFSSPFSFLSLIIVIHATYAKIKKCHVILFLYKICSLIF
jgi:steroid 5-alpha reductase family enzyme